MSDEPVYEMFWDCSYCGQTKNLGLTHRHCPSCGAPQQPDRRYFPPENEKVAVADHPFVGADRTCPACRAPSSAAASNCGQCGSPLDGASAVDKLADAAPVPSAGAPVTPPPAAAAATEKKGGSKLWIGCLLGALVLTCVGGGALALFWKEEKAITVDRHAWRRAIAIERYQTVNDSDWCDSLPPGARVTRRQRRERGTRRVQDGQECTTRNVDNGDGTFRQRQDCRPRYRNEPTYADHCSYTVDRWTRMNEVVAQGNGMSPAPSWPVASVTGCTQIGCTRAGARTETYTLHLTIEGEGAETCTVSQARWSQIQDGSRWKADVGVLTDSVDCDEMQPL